MKMVQSLLDLDGFCLFACLVLGAAHNRTPKAGCYNEQKFIWLVVLKPGKSKMEGMHLIRTFLLPPNMLEGSYDNRLGERENKLLLLSGTCSQDN
jgi:hypothetical protein